MISPANLDVDPDCFSVEPVSGFVAAALSFPSLGNGMVALVGEGGYNRTIANDPTLSDHVSTIYCNLPRDAYTIRRSFPPISTKRSSPASSTQMKAFDPWGAPSSTSFQSDGRFEGVYVDEGGPCLPILLSNVLRSSLFLVMAALQGQC